MDLQVTNDKNGKTSGKRVGGFLGLLIMGVISLYAIWKVPEQVGSIIWPWSVVVGGLSGISVMEKKQG